MRAVLVVPALLRLGAPLAGVPALARVAALADAPRAQRAGLGAALLAAAGLPPDTPPAPLAARGAGLSLTGGDVQYADPVTLVAGRDDVLFGGRVDDLAPAEADALRAHLNAHFAADGLAFCAPRADAWFLASQAVPLPETTPLTAVDAPVAPALPRGPHAKPWRRWLSETQMLLHEHPVNERRAAAGRAPVTGVWLWGGGPVAGSSAASALAVYAAEGRAGDLARGLAAAANPLPGGFDEIAGGHDTLVVLPAVTRGDALPALERAWLAPLVAALHEGALEEALLVADDGDVAHTWHARRPSAWQRLRARFTAARFTVPTPP